MTQSRDLQRRNAELEGELAASRRECATLQQALAAERLEQAHLLQLLQSVIAQAGSQYDELQRTTEELGEASELVAGLLAKQQEQDQQQQQQQQSPRGSVGQVNSIPSSGLGRLSALEGLASKCQRIESLRAELGTAASID